MIEDANSQLLANLTATIRTPARPTIFAPVCPSLYSMQNLASNPGTISNWCHSLFENIRGEVNGLGKFPLVTLYSLSVSQW